MKTSYNVNHLTLALIVLSCCCFVPGVSGQTVILDSAMHHLRNGAEPEWADFPRQPEAAQLVVHFEARKNAGKQSLRIRHWDVRHPWLVMLNGNEIGKLARDEKDVTIYLDVPPEALVSGANELRIRQSRTIIDDVDMIIDDIMVSEIALDERPKEAVLSEATLLIEVSDKEHGHLLPSKITIVNTEGSLQSTGEATDGNNLAIRPGNIYTGNGKASFGMPAGIYTVYAGRGFEYGVDSVRVELKPGQQVSERLVIRREVPTEGWISSDTHVHTYTHSGHGDATVAERAITIAGEAIELPVITDHNKQIDILPAAKAMGVDSYYTPVTGNEVTTRVGHFNVFPLVASDSVISYWGVNWNTISENFHSYPGIGEKQAIILNHARDFHGRFRPFGPERHIAVAGWNLDGWKLPANSMEVINSGALKTDVMRLYHDWFAMLNRGHHLTPVGASDSHDVSRYMLGQGRTYIRSTSVDPGQVDTAEAMKNFRAGKVMVSFGLLAEITVDSLYGPGELVPASDEIRVSVRVLGPQWADASHVALYANGQKIKESVITDGSAAGVKWTGTWILPSPKHDVFLVAVAKGPGIHKPFWQIPRPYQPDSPVWVPRIIGTTGAVWIDADNDGKYRSAYDYASAVVDASNGDMNILLAKLADYDEAVAVQAAALLYEQGKRLTNGDRALLEQAVPAVQHGFGRFIKAYQLSEEIRGS